MRILTCGTSYLGDEGTVQLAKIWHRVYRHLNKPTDDDKLIIVDAHSPFEPVHAFPGEVVFRFDENVGAITRGGKDGAGRGLCKAVELAVEGGFDYVCIYETDFIFAKAIRPIVERMHKAGVKVASPGFATPYMFPEFGVFFLNVKYAQESHFIERYNWENSPPLPIVEMRLESIFGEDLWFLPFRGMRNEHNTVNVANVANIFPYQMPSWLTHVADLQVYFRFLDLNGVHLT